MVSGMYGICEVLCIPSIGLSPTASINLGKKGLHRKQKAENRVVV